MILIEIKVLSLVQTKVKLSVVLHEYEDSSYYWLGLEVSLPYQYILTVHVFVLSMIHPFCAVIYVNGRIVAMFRKTGLP